MVDTAAMSNAAERALRRIAGDDTYEMQVGAVVDQVYRLTLSVPQRQQLLGISVQTESGNVDITVQKVDADDVVTDITGLVEVNASAVKANAAVTGDGTEVVEQGETLQFETTNNAAGINLSFTLRFKKIAGNNPE